MAAKVSGTGMTSIEARNDRVTAVHSIDHYALQVPDLAAAESFMKSFGLVVSRRDGIVEAKASDGHTSARFVRGDRKALAYLSFNCFAEEFDDLRRRVGDNCVLVDGGKFTTAEGFWFRDCDGNLLQVKPGPKTSPNHRLPLDSHDAEADERGALVRSKAGVVRPRRLSHVLLFTPNVMRALDFYHRTLGLKLSDRSGDGIAFTHAPHGSDHHLVAFAKSEAKGWHHAAWDVASVDEVGRGAEQMAAEGYKEGWGTGRHVLGSNYFHYVRDPWGSFCEYSAGIDYVSAGFEWPAGDFPPEDALYLWGPDMPDFFVQNTELAGGK
ncbi:glyoxalase/Bleomycin resistance /Dioxygenase superfamily protein [Burkholderia pseudomallei]|nr:glyoxalase/Bleomycin resistance /Dioxygenase superfamily protein [Burkholderia pseudomallei]